MKLLLQVHASGYGGISYAAVEIDDEFRTFVRSVQRDGIRWVEDKKRAFVSVTYFDHTPVFYEDLPEELEAVINDNGDDWYRLPDDIELPEQTARTDTCVLHLDKTHIYWTVYQKHGCTEHETRAIYNDILFDPGFEERILKAKD